MTQLRKFRDKTTAFVAFLISTFLGFLSKPPPASADEANTKPIVVAQSQSSSVYNVLRGGVYKSFDNSQMKEAPAFFNNSNLKEAPAFDNSMLKEAPAILFNNSNLKEAPAFDNNMMKEAPAPLIDNGSFKEAPSFDNSMLKEAPALNLTADVENTILNSVVGEVELKIRHSTELTEADRAVLILIEQNRELSIENRLLKIKNGAPTQ